MPLFQELSRRAIVRLGAGVAALTVRRDVAAQEATPVAERAAPLPDEITAIIEGPSTPSPAGESTSPIGRPARPSTTCNGGERFLAASTTKLFPGAAALAAYGADYRFETPVYRTGAVGADGTLAGDLILVASGDPTMGGRTTPDGHIAFTPIDHIYANVFPTLATLTPEDPLAGLDDLARQVAAAGIRRVDGDVIIDARLFPAMEKDDYILTPIWINDNLIDLSVTPGRLVTRRPSPGAPRPRRIRCRPTCKTVAASETLELTVDVAVARGDRRRGADPGQRAARVADLPGDGPAGVRPHPADRGAGVGPASTVTATATGPNPDDKLPPAGSYAEADRVALLTSPPFAENIKLILKVSMNQHADMLIFLLALKHGETDLRRRTGADPAVPAQPRSRSGRRSRSATAAATSTPTCSARGPSRSSSRRWRPSPTSRPTSTRLPILGVDGSEIDTVAPTSPVRGKAFAKSGTTVAGDVMNQRALTMVRALAGYLTAKSGRELIFTIYVSDVPLADVLDVLTIIKEQGSIAEVIYELN